MSLRLRLMLMLAGAFVFVFLAGAVLALRAAHNAVAQQVSATTGQSRQLIEEALREAEPMPHLLRQLLARLATDSRIRQVTFTMVAAGDQPPLVEASSEPVAAPGWFVRLVSPEPRLSTQTVPLPGSPGAAIIIHADPGAEMVEAWGEVRMLLVSIAVFAIAAGMLVFLGIGRGMRPLTRILEGLDAIEQGDFGARLARPNLPELGRIADRVNRIAEALEQSRDEARRYAGRAIAIREEERRYLARELHDELGQTCSAIKALAISIEQRGVAAEPAIGEQARTIAEASDAMLATIRDLMRRLRPVVLDELGLTPALEQLVDDWNGRNADAFCALRIAGPDATLDAAVEISIYRIVQEALTNVARHAAAQRIEIDLVPGPGKLRLQLRDDGCGFDPERTSRGLGLAGMQERIAALDGEFTIRTAPGAGVAIDIEVPLPLS